MANTPHRSAAAGPQKPSSIRKHENDNRQFIEAQLSLSLGAGSCSFAQPQIPASTHTLTQHVPELEGSSWLAAQKSATPNIIEAQWDKLA